MDEVLQTLAVLLTALLWGGVVIVDLVVTPARVMTPDAEAHTSAAIGTQTFRWFGYVQVLLAAAALVIVLVGGAETTVLLPAVFLLVLAVLSVGVLEPAMASLKRPELSPEELEANQSAYTQLQRAYFAADAFKMVLGAILLSALVTL